jgi:3,4-dihydroxy-9,10-secoandrosta-1,3,5(10)-triene-9,17-dione 4,5-dioxygenase
VAGRSPAQQGDAMDIRGLGYIGLAVADGDAWRVYARALGAMVVDAAGDESFGMKIDDRPYRVLVQPTAGEEGLAFAGWELPDETALHQATAELEVEGHGVEESTVEERAARQVRGLVRTTDPAGTRVELFWGPVLDHERFVSPTGVSGFVTGDLGLGHIVLGTPDLARSVDFYTRVLGFRVSDYWKPGPTDVVFARCNPRHHSIALVSAAETTLYHFMVEANTIDDVGSTLDRIQAGGGRLSMGLGRHTNDLMLSFYSTSPSGFDVEFGCGGRRVDDASWIVTEITKPSSWGHRPPTTADD